MRIGKRESLLTSYEKLVSLHRVNWKLNNCNNQECKLVIESKEFLKIHFQICGAISFTIETDEAKHTSCLSQFPSTQHDCMLSCIVFPVKFFPWQFKRELEFHLTFFVFLVSIKIIKILVIPAVTCCCFLRSFVVFYAVGFVWKSLLIVCCWVHVCAVCLWGNCMEKD